MDEFINYRWGLLRVYAELDEEYKQLTQQAARAELALILQDFTPNEVKRIRAAIDAHNAVNRRLVQLACERMIFRSELEEK